MTTMLLYKTALLALLAVTGASIGGSTYYYQQSTAQQNDKIASLTSQVNSSSNSISSLNSQVSQLQSANSQLNAQNSQLLSEVNQLQAQIKNLKTQTVTHTIVVSSGTLGIPEGGTASTIAYIPFSVPANSAEAFFNLTFTTQGYNLGGENLKAVLLNQTQYSQFTCCVATNANNYTLLPTTWSTPWAGSYTAQVSIPYSGNWWVAFLPSPGYVYGGNVAETITLTTRT